MEGCASTATSVSEANDNQLSCWSLPVETTQDVLVTSYKFARWCCHAGNQSAFISDISIKNDIVIFNIDILITLIW